jgi:hypothetical protein
MRVQCEICFEFIAQASQSFLSYPMTGAMFTSIDPFHGMPDPFPASLHWDDFRCPYGAHRPFTQDDMIMTDEGAIVLPRDGSKAVPAIYKTIKIKEEPDEPVENGISEAQGKEEEGFKCETCQKVFPQEINMKRHARMAHKEK